ncbi:MAG: GerMN domain-containing protein [Pleurocapsa sp.]
MKVHKVHNKSPNSTPILIGLSLLLVGVAQITALWALTRAIFPLTGQSSSIVEVQPAQFTPQLYWLKIVDNRIQLATKTFNTSATSPEIALEDAFAKLLANSSNFELISTIPQKTRLLQLQVTPEGIYLDLSQEFSQGGGSTSMIYRVAQVLYTATSIDPQAAVFLSIEGQPLDEDNPLGGEGLLLDYPLTREKFTQDFLVE